MDIATLKRMFSPAFTSYFLLVLYGITISGSSFFVLGTKEMPIGTEHTFIEALIFMPGGKDFYQKFVRQAKPVLFKETFKGSILNATTHDTMNNLEKMLNKELFNFDKKKMPFAHWYNKSRTEKIDIDLRANGSTILEEIYLPIMLQCREYKLDYEQFQISIFSRKAAGNLKQIDQEMLLFSFENGIKIELYDSLYSSKLLGNQMQIVDGLKSGIATLMKGDILYVPKYWWMNAQTSDHPKLGFKLFFNLVNLAGKQQEADAIVDKLKKIEEHKLSLEKLPLTIDCTKRTLSLRQVLKINESDPKTLQLRLPKKAERPQDFILKSGYKMPVLGLGTALLNEKTTETVKYALDIGYRLIDTAQGYPGSETGIAQALYESSVPRSEVFIVTKLHPRFLGYDSTIKAIDMSMKSLNVDYIDLFLIHSKECDDFLLKCQEGEPYGTWQETWKAMEHAHKMGKIRSLGVSNFNIRDLKKLQEFAEIPISVVQNWFDPIHQDITLRKFCSDSNIRYMGYSTLGGMWTVLGLEQNPILTSSLLTDLSTHYDYFVSSLVLSWAIHHNVTVIPRSTNKNHLAQNLRALDMKLSKIDIAEIDSMSTILDDVLRDMMNEEENAMGHGKETGNAKDHGDENTSAKDHGKGSGNAKDYGDENASVKDHGKEDENGKENEQSTSKASSKNQPSTGSEINNNGGMGMNEKISNSESGQRIHKTELK